MTVKITITPIEKPPSCICDHSEKEHGLITGHCLHVSRKGVMNCHCEKYAERLEDLG